MIGRFISADILMPNFSIVLDKKTPRDQKIYIFDPQLHNRYSYCANNPLKYIDPSGYIIKIKGTEEEKKTIKEALNKMAGTDVPVNEDGYVSDDFKSPEEYKKIEKWLKEIIQSEIPVEVFFGEAAPNGAGNFGTKGHGFFVQLDWDMKIPNQQGHTYWGKGNSFLDIFGSPHPHKIEGVFSHELLGHGLDCIRLNQNRSLSSMVTEGIRVVNDQPMAIKRTNIVRKLLGIPKRTR